MRALGAVLIVAGSALAARCGLLLAGRGRPRRGPRPRFVVAGPYRRTRNPLSAGVLVAAVGASLATGSPWLGFATAVAVGLAHAWIVLVEEPRLLARFGDTYEVYLRCVPRWLPRARAPEPLG